jgi:hypothetical protein
MPKTLRLPVDLDDTEKLKVSSDLSATITALEAAEAKKKIEMKSHNDVIKELKTSVHTLNISLSTGTCEREIEVEEREIPEDGIVQTIRLDTNAVVSARSMDPEERQLRIAGSDVSEAVKDKLRALNKTEEQALAGSPEEAEAMRDTRIAEEKATQAFDSLTVGSAIEVLIDGEWLPASVEEKNEFSFTAALSVYDVSKHGISWRLNPTWNDLVAASEEAARFAEIDRLAAEQAADKPKALLSSRRAKAEAKRLKVQDVDGNPILPPTETPPPSPLGDDDIAF